MSPSAMCRASGFVLALIVSSAADRALAEPGAERSSPADGVGSARDILDERESRARVWQYGWGATGYGLALGFGALAATTDDDDARLSFGFAAGGIFIDTTMHMLSSIEANAASRARERPDRAMAQLRLAAEAEEQRQSLVLGHLLPAGFATAAGLVLWLGFDNLEGAIFNTAAAIATNEVRALTQPTSALDAWTAYQQGQRPSDALPSAAAPRASWSVALTGAGCAIVGTF